VKLRQISGQADVRKPRRNAGAFQRQARMDWSAKGMALHFALFY
jgi:hypothetical protein